MENFNNLEEHLYNNEVTVMERTFSGSSAAAELCEAWAANYMASSNEDLTLNLDVETMSREEALESVATDILNEELGEVE